ncbi:MAG: lipopolysaccharide assembly protein LapA domain-containing protein [Spirochaetota bacterium]
MGRIIFSILSLIALAVIIVMNAGTIGSFNVFGWEFEEVPIIVIAIISFVLGALYSFIFYITSYFARSRKEKLAMQKQRLKSQEETIKTKDASLKAREKQADAIAATAQKALPANTGHAGGEPYAGSARSVGSGRAESTSRTGASRAGAQRPGGWLRNFFGKGTASGR